MKRVLVSVAILAVMAIGPVGVQPAMAQQTAVEQQSIAAAQQAALTWLAMADKDDVAGTYRNASAFFKKQVSQQVWTQNLQAAHQQVGAAKNRQLATARYMTQMPNAPKGEYVLMLMQTAFEKHPSALETITMMRDPDGTWRLAGYYIN